MDIIAVVSSDAGRVTKYQRCATQAEADTHVADQGGFAAVEPGNMEYWVADPIAKTLTHDAAQEAADIKAKSDTQYIRDREEAYPPIGDQLDAILKQLNSDRLGGKAMIQDVDDVLATWLNVKVAHPKPGV